jgi:hypothetical protein
MELNKETISETISTSDFQNGKNEVINTATGNIDEKGGFQFEDPSFKDLQEKCGMSSSSTIRNIQPGISLFGKCQDDILWFDSSDVNIISDEGEIKVSREDVENNSNYKETTSGKIEGTKTITIKPNFGSKFIQKMMEIQMRAQTDNGETLKKYSDGGFHLKTTLEDSEGNFQIVILDLNMKFEGDFDALGKNFSDGELEMELSFMIERPSSTLILGVLPENFGFSEDFEAPEISGGTTTTTATEVTVKSAVLTDTLGCTDGNIYYVVYGIDNNIIGSTISKSGTEAKISGTFTPNAGQKLVVTMGYLISGGNVPFPVHKIDVTVS